MATIKGLTEAEAWRLYDHLMFEAAYGDGQAVAPPVPFRYANGAISYRLIVPFWSEADAREVKRTLRDPQRLYFWTP